MECWYKIQTLQGHFGKGKAREIHLYVYAKNAVHAIDKLKEVPTVHKDKVLSLVGLSEQESKDLESLIVNEKRVFLNKARMEYYMPSEFFIHK
ncbi:hypothetical protein J4433_00225 [Candidatus Pacearchaeota archaeon]|nr:hypothetical protein [Candidatus Pacearchaeota archaeon]